MKEYQWELLRVCVETSIKSFQHDLKMIRNDGPLKKLIELKIKDLEIILNLVKSKKL